MDLVNSIISLDHEAFLLINGFHSPFWDAVMWQISDLFTWIPLYVFFLYLIQRRYGWRGLGIAVPVIALMIFLTDTGSVMLFKNTVQRLRPSHVDAFNNSIHLLTGSDGQLYRGGEFGFVSSHASNHFGIAVFMAGLLSGMRKWITPALLLWAGIICYSRIYLGVHFPADVVVGALYGGIIGFGCAFSYKQLMVYFYKSGK